MLGMTAVWSSLFDYPDLLEKGHNLTPVSVRRSASASEAKSKHKNFPPSVPRPRTDTNEIFCSNRNILNKTDGELPSFGCFSLILLFLTSMQNTIHDLSSNQSDESSVNSEDTVSYKDWPKSLEGQILL